MPPCTSFLLASDPARNLIVDAMLPVAITLAVWIGCAMQTISAKV
jgi:hypothetical protein